MGTATFDLPQWLVHTVVRPTLGEFCGPEGYLRLSMVLRKVKEGPVRCHGE